MTEAFCEMPKALKTRDLLDRNKVQNIVSNILLFTSKQ